ncbi:uncharacterized protein PFL1_03291 [Pseudozyma flocculosa PF-1]|uniref:RlpA-like protein double-psi beta-barrel domain-containing protein n=2 Tax=Pseudozyma flocculosa TaxID=84751 RepID=A0A5C3F647_9BASI|nr:uncharacterized protein PFL1_03291 [Pseudozyma flocculosa PF-1]EPQ29001.1 hypothetical protein PFL1_03291 [Pseudozyma flocculosa PF-1]SPO39994.1 uncharacterized protein PSFLO_05476 [Pseudozyma flocculosa]
MSPTPYTFTRLVSLLLLGLALTTAAGAVASDHADPGAAPAQLRRHAAGKSRRHAAADDDGSSSLALAKRGQTFHGQATFYDAGLGACGGYNSGSDFIVALNAAQYGDMGQRSSWCGKQITITYPVLGITQHATVVDVCPGCAYGSLDMSRGLFGALSNQNFDLGVFQMSWTADDGSGGEQKPKPKPTPTSTSTTPKWTPPATTKKAPRTSSTPSSTPEPTTSSHTPVQHTPSPTLSSSLSSSTSSSQQPAPTPKTDDEEPPLQNLANLEALFDGLSGMAVAAAS